MSTTLVKPPILDETGRDIITKLTEIKNALDAQASLIKSVDADQFEVDADGKLQLSSDVDDLLHYNNLGMEGNFFNADFYSVPIYNNNEHKYKTFNMFSLKEFLRDWLFSDVVQNDLNYPTDAAGDKSYGIKLADQYSVADLKNTLNDKLEQKIFEVKGDGVKTYRQLLDTLYSQIKSYIDSLYWVDKRRLCINTRHGSWYVTAIGSTVLEFYGYSNILDTMATRTWFAFKLQSSGSSVIRVVETFDESTHKLTETKTENWSNSVEFSNNSISITLV